MKRRDEIIISIKPRYANGIFDGSKTVELRTRRPNIAPGTRIWIYVTTPVAEICGYADLLRISTGTPAEIWSKLGQKTAISREEFDDYFENRDLAHALELTDVMKMKNHLPLERIRELVSDFHPPQFFCRLNGAGIAMRLENRSYQRIEQFA
jgi:predicted transcriptional regulator